MSDLPAPHVAAELSELEGLMRTDPVAYQRREGRYRELLEAGETGGSVTPRRSAEKERAEIERVMRETPRLYFGNDEMQARYRDLLEAEDGGQPDAGEQPRPGDPVPVLTPSAWAKSGGEGDYEHYRHLVASVNDVMNGAGRDAAPLETSFSVLPERIQSVCFSEMVNRGAVAAEPVSDAELGSIIREGGNAELAREWGADAPVNFGKVRAKLWRAVDRMNDQDAATFINWFARLPPGASASLQRWLAA